MVSRILHQLNLLSNHKPHQPKLQSKSPSRPDTKSSRRTSTPRNYLKSPISPIKPLNPIFEIKKICFSKPPEPPPRPPILSTRQLDLVRCSSISPRKIRSAALNIKQKVLIENEISQFPSIPSKTYYNERLLWKKRKIDLPLCIVNFNGIVGNFDKKVLKDKFFSRLNVVPGVKQGFNMLSRSFLVAIVSWSRRCDTKAILEYLEENDVKFDAFYIVRHRNFKYRFRHNYTQILLDFQLPNSSDCIITLPLTLPLEEATERKGPELFYESSQSGTKRFTTIGLPDFCEDLKPDPLCILLPHCSTSNKPISFTELSKYLKSLIKDLKVSNIITDNRIHLPSESENIGIIPLKPKNLLTGTRYLVYTGCLDDKIRPSRHSSYLKLK